MKEYLLFNLPKAMPGTKDKIMQLNSFGKNVKHVLALSSKLWLIMQLTVILMFAACLQVSAAAFGQQVTIVGKDIPLKQVFRDIRKQTGYNFIYTNKVIKEASPVTMNARNMDMREVLDKAMAGQPLTYTIQDKIIIIGQKPETILMGEQSFPQKEIGGIVTDSATGKPLVGVTIQVKGITSGTVTDNNGHFSINVPDNAILVASYLGYNRKEIRTGNETVINFSMVTSTTALNQLVVIGYGTQKRISLTGAVSQVTSKDIEGKPVTNVLQALQGEAPNLIIQETSHDPGSGVNLNIRGIGTLGDNSPLVVIDGVVGGDINQINPNDIESVSILKDAVSAAIYGSRAANGVILITTKKGELNQKAIISYNGSYGFQHPDVLLKKVDAWDNAYYKNLALVNSGLSPSYTPDQIAQLKAQGNGTWDLEHLLRDAPFQTHNLTISGGGPTNSYYISGGYQNQGNMLIGNGGSGPDFGYQRYNLMLSQTSVIGKLEVNIMLSYNKNRNKTPAADEQFVIADANRVPYNYSWQDSAGNYLTNPISSQFNQMGVLEKGGYNQSNNDQVFGNLNAAFHISPDLKLNGLLGGTLINNSSFYREIEVNDIPSGISGNNRTVNNGASKSLLTNVQLYATYHKTVRNNAITALLGGSNESYTESGFRLQQLYTDVQLGTPTTGTILDPNNSFNSNASTTETSINSLFGRLSYSYKDEYFIDASFREDGSSKFASGKRWGFFPSLGASWILTEEPFMQRVKNTINVLKLRASYGVLGNQNVNAYQYQTTYFNYNNAYGFNNTAVGGAGYILGNPDLTWEKAATSNIGVDLAFFGEKLNITFDYFNKVTSDILASRQDVPALYGAGLPDYNVAKVQDYGWGTTISYELQTNKISQTFSFNLADNKNKLLTLTYSTNQEIVNEEEYSLIRKVGEPITQYYGYKVAGIFQTQEEINKSARPVGLNLAPGDLKYIDVNHDGVINAEDKVPLGNPFPRFTFGFTYRISVDNFDMSLFIQGVGKRAEMIRGEDVEPYQANYSATMFQNQTDFWTPENRNAKYPRLAESGTDANANDWGMGSSIYLFDAAYARLKNINIGYTIPERITKKLSIEKLRVSLVGQNLLTLSKLNFVDPETSEFNNDLNLNAGENSARNYPLPIFYGMGLNVTF